MVRAEHNPLLFVFLCVCLLLFAIPQTSLQAQTLSGQSSATLIASPQFPTPNQEVSVSLDAYSMNTLGATITWYVDKVELTDRKNERSIKFTSGPIGTTHTVRSVIRFPSGLPLEAVVTIPITQVDIIVETDSYTPSFYQGRALPSENSHIRAVAVLHGKTPETPAEYTYEWKLDGDPLFGGPIRGKRVIETRMPLYQDHTLTVVVYNTRGTPLGRRTIALDPTVPEVHFYEENPLRGLSRKAITDDFVLIGEETTVHAEPYFMNIEPKTFSGEISWELNGEHVDPTGVVPNAITLRHVGGEGSANIAFRYITQNLPPQLVEKAFSIFFK